MRNTRLMKIKYPHEEELKNRLHTCLDMCGMPHVIHDNINCYVIYIDKGKCTWKQVMQEVNRVHAVMFRYENNVWIENGMVYEDCGTIYI